ncbi:MAG: PilZ domain-containing protein [Syntrophorhabdaceae bacterium]
MSADDERREFFRIRDRIPLEFRTITREEFITLQDRIRCNSTQIIDRTNELYFIETHDQASTQSDQLYGYMQMINKKLDMIIEFLGQSAGKETMTATHTEVNISGSGIQFLCDVPLRQGEFVQLKIIIPVFPYPKITSLCQVLRIETEEEGAKAKWVALKFMVINEKDRDVLINYVFLKERQYLRQKKETSS